MSDQKRDPLVSKISQLQQNQQVLAKYLAGMKRRLDDLTEQFNNRPELQQINSLQDRLAQLHSQLDERSAPPQAPVEVVNLKTKVAAWVDERQQQPLQAQSYEYQLVFDRSGSRAVLIEALEKAQERLIIVCPWLNRNSIDADLLQKFRDCLNRNCRINIGWGHLSDRARIGKGWRYDALRELRQLEQDYPDWFKLKLLGTHEKFLVCDRTFAMLGSHNLLTSSAQSAEREVGIRTTDPHIIQGLIDRFDGAEVQDAQAIDESLTAGSVSLHDAEALDAQDIGDESNASFVNLDDEPDEDEYTDDFVEDSQEPAVSAEEFLRRYNEKQRDFTGINLTGANLSGKSLTYDVNLSKANLSGANLSRASWCSLNLSGANLRSAELCEANLSSTNLSEANLENADISNANLSGANLEKVNLRKANLTGVKLLVDPNFNGVNLSGANLSGINLTRPQLIKADLSHANLINAYLCWANLTKANLVISRLIEADLSNANLSQANLSSANLTAAKIVGANLIQANLQGTNLTAADLSKVNLKNTNLYKANLSGAILAGVNLVGVTLQGNLSGADLSGANLCGADLSGVNLSGANLTSADLRGANLENANLEKANLKEANLSGANLKQAKLSGATMPDGTTHE